MNLLWLLLIPYCTLAFGIHGGEGITGINRQVRNILCAMPFGLTIYFVSSQHWDFPLACLAFVLAYIGTSMGFTKYPLWLKGLVTCFPFGAGLLPLVYWLSYKTKWTNVLAEYATGTAYSIVLVGVAVIACHV